LPPAPNVPGSRSPAPRRGHHPLGGWVPKGDSTPPPVAVGPVQAVKAWAVPGGSGRGRGLHARSPFSEAVRCACARRAASKRKARLTAEAATLPSPGSSGAEAPIFPSVGSNRARTPDPPRLALLRLDRSRAARIAFAVPAHRSEPRSAVPARTHPVRKQASDADAPFRDLGFGANPDPATAGSRAASEPAIRNPFAASKQERTPVLPPPERRPGRSPS
jgi:hypothetical protein